MSDVLEITRTRNDAGLRRALRKAINVWNLKQYKWPSGEPEGANWRSAVKRSGAFLVVPVSRADTQGVICFYYESGRGFEELGEYTESLFVRAKELARALDSQSLARLSFAPDLTGPPQMPVTGPRADHRDAILADLARAMKSIPAAGRAVSVNSLLDRIRIMRDDSPDDPFVEVAMALHDALQYRNRWINCTPDQFAAAHRVLRALAARHSITSEDAEKAIQDLEDAGLDTLPFETTEQWGLDE